MARQLTRDPERGVLAGVAAGLGDYFDVDPVLFRLGFVVLALFNGVGVIAYVICWVVMPARTPSPAAGAGAPSAAGDSAAGGAAGPGGAAAGSYAGAAAGPGTADTAAAAGQAPPADRVVQEVRAAGEKVVESLRATTEEPGNSAFWIGLILIAIGLLFLIDRFDWWIWPNWARLADFWPVILIVAGIAMIFGARRRSGG